MSTVRPTTRRSLKEIDPVRHFEPTPLLDYRSPSLIKLIEDRGWRGWPEPERLRAIYEFVRDEIAFGYNASDDVPASQVLRDGYGQCNTKSTLFMALVRGAGGPATRLHGFTVHKELQRGVVPALLFLLAPKEILHSWVEVHLGNEWIRLEGLILDLPLLRAIQRKFPDCSGRFCGFGIATADFRNPPVEWTGGDTFIQRESIAQDLSLYDSPDEFYRTHGTNLGGIRELLFRHAVRHLMNRRVRKIRNGLRR